MTPVRLASIERAAVREERDRRICADGAAQPNGGEIEIAAAALRRSEDRFAKLFRASPDAICVCRMTDHTLIEINNCWTTIFGYSADEAIGRTPTELAMFADEEQRCSLYGKLHAEGCLRDFAIDLLTKNGEIRNGVVSAQTVDVGDMPCLLTVIRDVTEQRRAEMALQAQREELAHLSRVAMLGELSCALTHELRQPLTSILLNVRTVQVILSRCPDNSDSIDEILCDIVNDNHRASRVIDRMREMIASMHIQPNVDAALAERAGSVRKIAGSAAM